MEFRDVFGILGLLFLVFGIIGLFNPEIGGFWQGFLKEKNRKNVLRYNVKGLLISLILFKLFSDKDPYLIRKGKNILNKKNI